MVSHPATPFMESRWVLLLLLALMAPGANADVFNIGTLIESSGGWYAGNDIRTGASLAQADFKASPWAAQGNHTIEFKGFNVDTACNPSTALGTAASLLEDTNNPLIGILGPGCSSSSMPTSRLTAHYNLPQMSPASTAPQLAGVGTYPNFLRMATSGTLSVAGLAELAASIGVVQAATLIADQPYFVATAVIFSDAVKSFGGALQASSSIPMPATAAGTAAAVNEITKTATVGVYVGMYGPETEMLAKHCGDLCRPGYVLLSNEIQYEIFNTFSDSTKAAMNGWIAGVQTFAPSDASSYSSYLHNRHYPKMLSDFNDTSRTGTESGIHTYNAIRFYGLAIEAVAKGEKTTIHAALRSIECRERPDGPCLGLTAKFSTTHNELTSAVGGFMNLNGNTWTEIATVTRLTKDDLSYTDSTTVSSAFSSALYAGGITTPPPRRDCPIGTYTGSISLCIACPSNTYGSTTGSTKCTACPESTEFAGSGATSVKACLCKGGFYSPSGTTGGISCMPCPYLSVCDGGLEKPKCRAEGGYWIDSAHDKPARVRGCNPPASCVGGSNCSCAQGYTGPMCKGCTKAFRGDNASYYRSGDLCLICPSAPAGNGGPTIDTIVVILQLLLFLVAVYALLMRMAKFRKASDKMAVAIRYLQQLSLILTFELSWPGWLSGLQGWLSILNLDIFETIPLECTVTQTVTVSLLLQLSLLPMMLIVFLLGYSFWRCMLKRGEDRAELNTVLRRKSDINLAEGTVVSRSLQLQQMNPQDEEEDVAPPKVLPQEQRVAKLKNAHIQAFMHLLMILFLFHCKSFLSYFDCTNFQDGSLRWKSDLTVDCHVGQHRDALPLAIFGLVVYVLGTPFVFLMALRRGVGLGFDFNFSGPSYIEARLEKVLGTIKEDRVARAKELFDTIDEDKNGKIDKSEFESLLTALGLPSLSERQRDVLVTEVLIQCEDTTCITPQDLVNILHELDVKRQFDARWRPIWLKFGASVYWWECVLALQTFSVVAVKVIWADEPAIAGTLALYLFVYFFLLQVLVKPFKSAPGNETAMYCCLCTVLTLVGALAMQRLEPGTDNHTAFSVLTLGAVCVGAYFIAKNAGRELYMNAKAEVIAKLAQSVMNNVPIFQDCDPAFVTQCSKFMVAKTLPSEFVLCSIGDLGVEMWVLTKGTVELYADDGSLVKRLTAEEDETPAFGELALLDEEPRKFKIVAKSEVEVKVLTRTNLRACFLSYEGAENAMLAAVILKYSSAVDPVAEEAKIKAASSNFLLQIMMKTDKGTSSSGAILLKQKQNQAMAELNKRLDP